jgi:hypothetical protein
MEISPKLISVLGLKPLPQMGVAGWKPLDLQEALTS